MAKLWMETSLIRAEYSNSDAATINTPINWSTLVEDTDSCVTTGTGTWKFTAPKAGVYQITALCIVSSGHIVTLYKNGSAFKQGSDGSSSGRVQLVTTVRLAVNDTIDVRDTTGTASSSPTASYIQITRIGS